jgi:hypothetical protein
MEEDWLRYGVTARRTRNQRRLAELHALRRRRREHRATIGAARLEAAQARFASSARSDWNRGRRMMLGTSKPAQPRG